MVMTGIALVVDISCCHRVTYPFFSFFSFFQRAVRGRLIGVGLDLTDGSIYKSLTRVQITRVIFFPLLVGRAFNARRIQLATENDLQRLRVPCVIPRHAAI